MMRVESRLRMIFCAVPAFMRVEPAITSSPVSARIGCEQASRIGASGLLEMPMVCAPREAASFRAAMVKGVRAARRDADDHVVGADVVVADPGDAFLDRILGVLDRLHDGAGAAGDQVDHPLVGPVEGRRQLRAVLDADAAGGAGARIDEPSAPAQAPDRLFRGGGDGGEGRPDRGDRRELALIEGGKDVEARPGVEVVVAGTEMFCRHCANFLPDQYRTSWWPQQWPAQTGRAGQLFLGILKVASVGRTTRSPARPLHGEGQGSRCPCAGSDGRGW